MAEQDLQIVVEAINNASTQLKQIEKDVRGLSDAINKQDKEARKASSGFGSLTSAIFKGNIAANLAMRAIRGVNTAVRGMTDYMKESVGVASDLEATMRGLDSVAQSYGYDVEEVRKASERLSEDGLLAPAESALALKNLLAGLSGATIDQAEAMVLAMKDTASYNRVLDNFGMAVTQTTKGIRNRLSMLSDSAGVQKNLSIIMREAGFEIQDLDENSKKFAATQALINGYLRESAFAMGDSADYTETYQGQVTALERSFLELKTTIGDLFMPTARDATGVIAGLVRSAVDFADENAGKLRTLGKQFTETVKGVVGEFGNFMERNADVIYSAVNFVIQAFVKLSGYWKVLINIIQMVVNGFETLGNNLIATGKIIYRALKGDWEGVAEASEDWLQRTDKVTTAFKGNVRDMLDGASQYQNAYKFDLKEWWDGIEEMDEEAWIEREKLQQEGGDAISEEDAKRLKTMTENLEKENRNYQRAVEKRVKAFEESFDDTVMKHRDSIQSLNDDIKSETEEYGKHVVELLKGYNEAVDEMEERHTKKTKSVLEDMEEERAKTKEVTDEISKLYNQEVELLRREGEARVGDLQAQLDRELALGALADQAKIEALKQMIAFEKDGLAGALVDKEEIYNDEIQAEEDKLTDKLEKIQLELDEENSLYDEALADRKADYDEDVQNLLEAHQEKIDGLNETLNEELAIREKFAEDFERIGDRMAEDDLSRMVRKHQDELVEMKRDHEEKVAEITKKGQDEGEGYLSGLTSGMESGYPQFKSTTDKIKGDFNDIGSAVDEVKYKIDGFGGGSFGGVGASRDLSGFGLQNLGIGSNAFARGGLASQPGLVGEAGPEVVLPLSFPKRMAQIMQSMGMGGGGGQPVTQNFYVTVNNQQDIDVLMERASFAMKQGGF